MLKIRTNQRQNFKVFLHYLMSQTTNQFPITMNKFYYQSYKINYAQVVTYLGYLQKLKVVNVKRGGNVLTKDGFKKNCTVITLNRRNFDDFLTGGFGGY